MPKAHPKKKRHFWAGMCPVCDWFTWMWTTIEGMYNEMMEHIDEEHAGVADFEIVKLGD